MKQTRHSQAAKLSQRQCGELRELLNRRVRKEKTAALIEAAVKGGRIGGLVLRT
jgi:hypothetical protein